MKQEVAQLQRAYDEADRARREELQEFHRSQHPTTLPECGLCTPYVPKTKLPILTLEMRREALASMEEERHAQGRLQRGSVCESCGNVVTNEMSPEERDRYDRNMQELHRLRRELWQAESALELLQRLRGN